MAVSLGSRRPMKQRRYGEALNAVSAGKLSCEIQLLTETVAPIGSRLARGKVLKGCVPVRLPQLAGQRDARVCYDAREGWRPSACPGRLGMRARYLAAFVRESRWRLYRSNDSHACVGRSNQRNSVPYLNEMGLARTWSQILVGYEGLSGALMPEPHSQTPC
jgi:hypothetical protein